MLSSHHGKTASAVPSSSDPSQSYYSLDLDQMKIDHTDSYALKISDDAMNAMDITRDSPRKQQLSIPAKMAVTFSPTVKPESISFVERLQRKDLFISTDMRLANSNNNSNSSKNSCSYNNSSNAGDHNTMLNSPLSPAAPLSPHGQLPPQPQHHQHQQHLHPSSASAQGQRNARSMGVEVDHFDVPPANCKVPMNLSRRSSLGNFMMSPPPSAGLVKSVTAHALYSINDHANNSDTPHSNFESPKPRSLQRQRSNLSGANRRHSVPNNVHNASNNSNTPPHNISIQRLSMGEIGAPSAASYLPTPTDATFRGSLGGDSGFFMDYAAQFPSTMPGYLPAATCDPSISAGIHPFDMVPPTATTEAWATGSITGIPSLSLPISNTTKSATIQYLQQLQQSMMQQSDFQALSNAALQQQQQQGMAIQQLGTPSGQPSQSRKNSKAKVKRRVGSLPGPSSAPTQSYMSAEMPWSALSTQSQQAAAQSIFPSHQCTSIDPFANAVKQQRQQQQSISSPTRLYYHGAAPCGNPEPLYEYLASPTVVPGLEIIGYDYYRNYVQILPICPETTCSMNQDPVYLNLLQAIYAHTIPFLDLAPGSEEETQRLKNGTPSAIATQSIQPPFKHLLPLNGSAGQGNNSNISNSGVPAGAPVAYGNHGGMTNSVSAPSFQQSTGSNSKLVRRSSMATIGSTSGTSSSSRRSSVVSNPSLSNPAKKKKNAPRTHPYKSTSVFKEDNLMVTEAILSQVGGLGGIGNSATISARDPRHKVAEKMVHMDEAEYAAHYSKHQQSINKSASTTALSLAQTLATTSSNSSSIAISGGINPCSLPPLSTSTSSTVREGMCTTASTTTASPLESIAAADFIRALSECNGGMNHLGLSPQNDPTAAASGAGAADMSFSDNELVSLENLMMMDSAAAAAVQAAAATAWPNWFDLRQLEKDVCQEGLTHQASAFTSASCSMTNLTLSNSTTSASFTDSNYNNKDRKGRGSRDNTNTSLLLSSSTDLAMMDDLLEGHQQSVELEKQHSQDSEMTLAVPPSSMYHQNSTSQVLVFDQYHASASSSSLSALHSSTNTASSTVSSLSSSSNSSLVTKGAENNSQSTAAACALKRSISNDLGIPYTSSLLTVLPFSAQHSHPIFPTRGNRRSGWYRSKSVASQGLSQITGVDYTTTCWYDVEQLQNVVRDSISFQDSGILKSLEDLTDPDPSNESTA
ncbi:hypothetical protein BGZ99_006921 [Dissophora globulifera]|uniref:Uncharacterized protein n=1 Tax=Dissophora globulifera TaxID=979702 RepID=A0A9P6RAY5_9FUNG|nr:hypothetical protein BGZ99_006921 [Dissophora globulifera]